MKRSVTRWLLCCSLAMVGAGSASAQVGRSLGVIDPNLAQGNALMAIPGLTPELVKAILESRPFMSMGEFDAFLGRNLDRDQRSSLYQRIFLPININATSDDELRLVPGMGARMLLEFRENRPFESLTTLNQEVGKYLSPREVAQLSQYLFVPVDINSGSDDDLRSIPGMTPKLLAAIKQRRPYPNLAAFTKAIARVVPAREAARLTRFVRGPAAP